MWAAIVVALGVVATVAVVVWFIRPRAHPELAASHSDERPDTPSERFYGSHPPGPAGPDAESQGPEDAGDSWNPRPPD